MQREAARKVIEKIAELVSHFMRAIRNHDEVLLHDFHAQINGACGVMKVCTEIYTVDFLMELIIGLENLQGSIRPDYNYSSPKEQIACSQAQTILMYAINTLKADARFHQPEVHPQETYFA